jgi:hypothetical protein
MFLPSLLLAPVDWLVAEGGPALGALLAVRLFSAAGLGLWIVLMGRITSRAAYERTAFLLTCSSSLVVFATQLLRPADNLIFQRFVMLLVVGFYAAIPNRPILQVIPALLASAVSAGLLLVRPSSVGTADKLSIVAMFALANGIGYLVSRTRATLTASETRAWNAEREAREALEKTMSELRVLRGVLPVCSHCRKIRTEVGEWQQMERYVREHSEADFSHGVCPDCAVEHYPDLHQTA